MEEKVYSHIELLKALNAWREFIFYCLKFKEPQEVDIKEWLKQNYPEAVKYVK